MGRKGPSSRVLWCGLGLLLLLTLQGAQCEHEPTESECRPYIVKALKEHHVDESVENDASSIEQEENPPIDEKTESLETSDEIRTGEDGAATTEDSTEGREETDASAAVGESAESQSGEEENKTEEDAQVENASTENSNQETEETGEEKAGSQENDDSQAGSQEEASSEASGEVEASVEGDTAEVEGEASQEATTESLEVAAELETAGGESTDSQEAVADEQSSETTEQGPSGEDSGNDEGAQSSEDGQDTAENTASVETASGEDTKEDTPSQEETTSQEASAEATQETSEEVAAEAASEEETQTTASEETAETAPSEESADTPASQETPEAAVSVETAEVTASEESSDAPASGETADAASEETAEAPASTETAEATASEETAEAAGSAETAEAAASEETAEAAVSAEATEPAASVETAEVTDSTEASVSKTAEEGSSEEAQQEPVEDLTREVIIPANLRPRDHITQILKLDEGSVENESAVSKTIDSTLNTLKKLYDNAIKPLEILYKYRDLSNRHFGDPEIFSKPLVLFMGPWSGGKSSTINYLLDLEFTELALRTGAEPSPAYFNILTYGEETEILDGTQLAADWTFSGLQKFGQGLLDRLRGVKLKSRLLEKVNIVEIPGILEIRKQVQRLFPFNDACQWFIDRADIIFLMYDPAKLDVGPETEAILDQLKGREYQTRIVLNKADQVKPEELMRVQGTLIWNISPLMSSQEPPVMYTTSLWSLPYETNAPTRLLIAQERALLRDLREAIDKRVENKIASARRFAVRVRNHAKMVDCYLTTYYNHKSFFGNKKKIADDITENPQKYHIYEGLSTLTNISRYDLPDPDMYRDFFRINNLYDFTKLSDTCTYFRGCPINKLDISIAYDLPDLVGKYKKAVEQAKTKS